MIYLLISLIFSLLIGFILIPFLKRKNALQRVSIYLCDAQKKKDKTPTFGGIIFIIPPIVIIIFLLIINKISFSYNLLMVIITFILYGILGFIDDYTKIRYSKNTGISIETKFLFQLIIGIIIFILFILSKGSTKVSFFIIKIDLKYLYGLFLLFILSSSSNAVNITDGEDGLAAGLCFICLFCLSIIFYNSNYILGNKDIYIFILSVCGSLLGFLVFNFYPAKIFMGDLGSLSLGGLIGILSIVLKKEFILIFISFVFIIETISSFIQIISIRYFNKKIFLKSPLHHHFEEKGYLEIDIVKSFYFIELLFSLIALLIYRFI